MKTSSIASMFFLLILLAVAVSACDTVFSVEGNGNIVKVQRDINSVDQLKVSGGFSVVLSQSESESLWVEADENLMDFIVTRVNSGVLEISSKESIKGSSDIVIYLTVKDLSEIDLSGAVDIKSEQELNFDEISISGSGASTLNLTLVTETITTDLSGANDVTLNGRAKNFIARLSGASDLNAFSFQVNNLNIKVTGAGDARVSVSETLRVSISGAGSVTYQGNPQIEQEINGAGSLKKR